MPLKHCADCAMRFHCDDCVRVNAIPKDELEHMITNQSPRLRFEDMRMGARYRKIYREIIVDGHPLKRHLFCKICRKPINQGIYGSSTPLSQHWRRHVLRGETPIYDDLWKVWKGELDMRTGTRQEDMNKFVVPIKLPHYAAWALNKNHPIQLFMQIDKDGELEGTDQFPLITSKKAKLDEPQENLDDTLPLPPLVIHESSTSTSSQ